MITLLYSDGTQVNLTHAEFYRLISNNVTRWNVYAGNGLMVQLKVYGRDSDYGLVLPRVILPQIRERLNAERRLTTVSIR